MSMTYRVTDERLGELGKVYRLVTTLLNPPLAPALQLIALYHPRVAHHLVAQLVGLARVVAVPDLVVVYLAHEHKCTNRTGSRLA
jgi:hypothetical protein